MSANFTETFLQRGADPNEMLEKVRCGSEQIDMRAPIGAAAKLTVNEGHHAPRFARFEPYPGRATIEGDRPSPPEGL